MSYLLVTLEFIFWNISIVLRRICGLCKTYIEEDTFDERYEYYKEGQKYWNILGNYVGIG